MRKNFLMIVALIVLGVQFLNAQTAASRGVFGSDLRLSKDSPASFIELQLPSAGSLLQGFMYKANGSLPHPTLILLHGYPGNERNLDLAQAVRAHGWNVVYFNYRGSWGSQGEFSFRHCVEDVKNLVAFFRKNAAKYQIDPDRIALFGHSMGGFVALKALSEIPEVRKGFALSTWDFYESVNIATKAKQMIMLEKEADDYFVLNKRSGKDLFAAVTMEADFHDLRNSVIPLADKELVMLDEHDENSSLAAAIRRANKNYFSYERWTTDHSFTNKRASLINRVLQFLDR